MADMSKIVGAVIAITVRMHKSIRFVCGKCDCNCKRSCTHHRRIHRIFRST